MESACQQCIQQCVQVSVRCGLSVDDAGQRHGGVGVGLRGWLEEGAGVPVRALLLVAQLVVVRPKAATAVPARIRLLSFKLIGFKGPA